MLAGFGLPELIFIITFVLLIIAIIDIIRSKFETLIKFIWLLVILFFPLIGPIAYLIVGRRQKIEF